MVSSISFDIINCFNVVFYAMTVYTSYLLPLTFQRSKLTSAKL